jgi:hypothetical protein
MRTNAFEVDDEYDQERASDGVSRYGAYLRQRAELFREIESPARWAALAFDVGSGPCMSPGYVRHHSRVVWWERYGDEDERTAMDVMVAVPPPAVAVGLAGREGAWLPHGNDRDGAPRLWVAPDDAASLAAWATLTVRVPLSGKEFPSPCFDDAGCPHVPTAKAAVSAVCTVVNEALADLLAVLGR